MTTLIDRRQLDALRAWAAAGAAELEPLTRDRFDGMERIEASAPAQVERDHLLDVIEIIDWISRTGYRTKEVTLLLNRRRTAADR